jgi:hypothetical protein
VAVRDRKITLAEAKPGDKGATATLKNLEHPGLDEDGNRILDSRRVAVADPDGLTVLNPQTGVTAVRKPGEVIPDWAITVAGDGDTE